MRRNTKLVRWFYVISIFFLSACSSMSDIRFFGRVDDQHGKPVANAEVYYIGTNNFIVAGAGRGRVYTDKEGYFELDTFGASLELTGIVDPAIARVHYPFKGTKKNVINVDMPGIVRFRKVDDQQGLYNNLNNFVDKNKPFVIHAWRLGTYDGAFNGRASLRMPSDGSMYTLELDNYRVKLSKGKSSGIFHVSCMRAHMKGNRDYGDWRVQMSPVNGGVIETNDLYTYLAPKKGYKDSINIIQRKNDPGYSHELINKRYYFAANKGEQYGSLFIHFQPFYNPSKDECNIRLKYKINPNGLRNLEINREYSESSTV